METSPRPSATLTTLLIPKPHQVYPRRRRQQVIRGSEAGHVYIWELLEGHVLYRLRHVQQALTVGGKPGTGSTPIVVKKDVVSVVAWNQLRKEWASAGSDGSVVVW